VRCLTRRCRAWSPNWSPHAGPRRIPVQGPAQHGVGTHQQADPAQHVAGRSVQQRGQECPVGGCETCLVAVQLSFEDRDVVPERQDLDVLGVVVLVTPRYASRSSMADIIIQSSTAI
jgi:hypothetical protein